MSDESIHIQTYLLVRRGFSILALATLVLVSITPAQADKTQVGSSLQSPRLKWQWGGCYSDWCETGWYSSPAVADLDGDGRKEVVGSGYSIFSLDGATGALEWRVAAGRDRSVPFKRNEERTYPGIILADVDADGELEIVTGHDHGYVSVYNRQGYFEPGWPQKPTTYEIFGLTVYDLNNDDRLEIIATADVRDPINTWVFKPDGTLHPGWPQWLGGDRFASGTYNDNVAVGDVDGDGLGEIVVPSDYNAVAAYRQSGRQLAANSMYNVPIWGQVRHFESWTSEIRGWTTCYATDPRSERNVGNFERGVAVIADVDDDGVMEVVSSGEIYDCYKGRRPTLYEGIYIFNLDRSRFNKGGYDWRTPPVDTGAPLSENFDVIRYIRPSPVVVDLDGDGKKEILYPTFDGRLHAFWLDKTEHYHWPYSVYKRSEGVYRYASEPAIADLNDDGHPEVIFASWPEARDNLVGKLHILDYMGNPLYELVLPPSWSTEPPDDWNGGLAAPTLADIDGDPDLELVLNTAHSGLVAYDLPGTANAHILWGTGRWNYQRTASQMTDWLASSRKTATPPGADGVITYTIRLFNSGARLPGARMTDTLPAEVHYLGNAQASSGKVGSTSEPWPGGRTIITWRGAVQPFQPITITFGVTTVSAQSGSPHALVNSAQIADGMGQVLRRQAVVFVNRYHVFLPVTRKQ